MPIKEIGDNKEKYFHPLFHDEPPKVNPINFEIIKNRLNTIADVSVAIHHLAAKHIHKLIEQMPDEIYVSEDYVDDDGHENRSFNVRCAMTVSGDRLLFDFTGTEKQARGFINAHWCDTSSNCYSPLMSMDPDCPRCYGATTPVEIIAEKGTLVNPTSTALP